MRYLMIVSVFALVIGCDRAGSGGAGGGGRPKIVATTTMIGDLVKQIAGDKVELFVLMPPGTDPHGYKPTTKDLADVSRGDFVFYNGLHLEGTMVELFEEKMKGKAVAVARDIPTDKLLPWQAGQGGAHDPHIWFDPTLWRFAAHTVRDELARINPANTAEYDKNLSDLDGRLGKLDEYIRQRIGQIPQNRRVLITSHDAFNYYGRRYELEVRGIQGISTETDAGLANIQEAVRFILQRKIPAIFVESSVNHATIKRVQADCETAGHHVKIPGELYSDAMGAPGEHPGYAVETYEGMLKYNTDTIANALK